MSHKIWIVLVAVATVLLRCPVAHARDLVVRPASGGAVLELAPERGAQVGRAELENRGNVPLEIARIAPRAGDDENPRLPAELTAGFEDGATTAVLAPGQKRSIVVRWRLPPDRRLREIYGHVMIEPAAGAPLALGFHGRLRGPVSTIGDHLLSWLIGVPLLGVWATAVSHFIRRRTPRSARTIAIGACFIEVILAACAAVRFDFTLTRYDGNDGFQLLERALLLPAFGIEYSVGVDGVSMVLLLVVALVVLSSSLLAGANVEQQKPLFWSLFMMADLGLIGALAVLDLSLLLGFLAMAAVSLALLTATFGTEPTNKRGASLLLAALVGVGAIGSAILFVASHATGGILVDGTLAPRVFSVVELLHIDVGRNVGTLAGMHAFKLLFPALLVGCAAIGGAFPLHGWSPSLLAKTAPALALLVSAGLGTLAAYVLFRVSFDLMPSAIVWAAPSLAALGAAGVLWAGIAAAAQREIRGFTAYAATAQLGIVLVALASCTGLGVEGIVALLLGRALSCTVLFGVAAVLDARLGATSTEQLGGLAIELPMLALIAAAGFLASSGSPGTFGFIGQALSLIGALPLRPLTTLIAALALVPLAVAHVRMFCRIFLGDPPPGLLERRQKADCSLFRTELSALLPAAALLVLLGIWPRPALRMVDATAFDTAARVNQRGPLEIVEIERQGRTVASNLSINSVR